MKKQKDEGQALRRQEATVELPFEVDCCNVMTLALDYTRQLNERRRRSGESAGLAQAFLFDRDTGAHTSSPVVYCIPGTGRGAQRVPTKNVLIAFCPFCGKQRDARALQAAQAGKRAATEAGKP